MLSLSGTVPVAYVSDSFEFDTDVVLSSSPFIRKHSI